MNITPVCPRCGTPATRVDQVVVDHFSRLKPARSKRWAACVAARCPVAYFCDRQQIEKAELTRSLWYKDRRQQVPVCYCSELTRGEIALAVRRGATAIHEVQRMTKKNRTGYCCTENPLGCCCREAFLRELDRAKQKAKR
jgi:hypothetical protein